MLKELKAGGRTPRITVTIGDRMREARKSTGASQGELAEVLEVSRQTIHDWETDKRRPSKIAIVAWAMVTGVGSEWLLTGEGTLEVKRESSVPHNRRSTDSRCVALFGTKYARFDNAVAS